MNNELYPTIADAMTYVKGLRFQNLVGAAFSSYGWSEKVLGTLNGILTEMKVELVSDGIKVKYVPDRVVLEDCYQLGVKVADKLKEIC